MKLRENDRTALDDTASVLVDAGMANPFRKDSDAADKSPEEAGFGGHGVSSRVLG